MPTNLNTSASTAQSLVVANTGTVQNRLRHLSTKEGWSVVELRKLAAELAQQIEFNADFGVDDAALIAQAKTWVGGDLTIAGHTPAEQVGHLKDVNFWRRKLKPKITRAIEKGEMLAGRVGGNSGAKYVSDFTAVLQAQQAIQQQEFLNASRVEAWIDGEIVRIALADIKDKKDKADLAELLAWANGFQKLAEKHGLEIAMLTLTLAGVYHAKPKFDRKNGEVWNQVTPDLAHRNLGEHWEQLRPALAQYGVKLAGFKAAEGHDDGCPHWHLAITYPPAQRARIMCEVLKKWTGKLRLRTEDMQGTKHTSYFDTPAMALSGKGRVAGKKKEAAQVDLSIVNISRNGANSLVSYIIKYVTKQSMKSAGPIRAKLNKQREKLQLALAAAVDPVERAELAAKTKAIEKDLIELEQKEQANEPKRRRSAAWRSVWGIRALQWFGIQKMKTPWRELRRVHDLDVKIQGVVRTLWERARAGDFEGFLELVGGLAAAPVPKQVSCRNKTVRRTGQRGQTVDKLEGVFITDELTGVEVEIITRPHKWTLITEYPQQAASQAQAAFATAQQISAHHASQVQSQKSITVAQSLPRKN